MSLTLYDPLPFSQSFAAQLQESFIAGDGSSQVVTTPSGKVLVTGESLPFVIGKGLASIFQSCTTHMFVSSLTSLRLRNPAPMLSALAHCVQEVAARAPRPAGRGPAVGPRDNILRANQQFRSNAGAMDSNKNKPSQEGPIAAPSAMDATAQIKHSLLDELSERIPKAVENFLRETTENGWIDGVIHGIVGAFDALIGFSDPVLNLEETMHSLEDKYWRHIISEDYNEIFPDPESESYFTGLSTTREQAIARAMRMKLERHGYQPLLHGTPFQFIELLKQRGVCEKFRCEYRDEL